MDITGVGSSSYLYGYGISDSDTKNVTGKENGIGSVDENGKQKECQTCKNRKYVDGSDEANVSFKSAAHVQNEYFQSFSFADTRRLRLLGPKAGCSTRGPILILRQCWNGFLVCITVPTSQNF